MAFHSETYGTHSGLLARVGAWFAGLGRAVFVARAAEARVTEMERLTAMSDAELAKLGLRREDIARHVFRDILYV
ncbi:MAG: DUF1127 domain-containing protein [Rhodobacter sp.]|nr:DUF1127 domain-containing protein [Rhodobacter sp.]